ncbi:MAG: DUF1203 domain-containing protein, partial [Pseudomonadota bacterium]
DAELEAEGAVRVKADSTPGFPCRISLADAEIGESVILANYRHLDMLSPYAASHAVYVREDAEAADPKPGVIPDMLQSRLLSLRAFDAKGHMRDADVLEGTEAAPRLEAMFNDPETSFVDLHFAKRGCFGARAQRA